MKSEIYIHQHMGLGDHLLCFGLIKELLSRYEKINLFCKEIYSESVNFLYKDEPNINVIPIEEHEIGGYIKNNNIDYHNDFLRIGFEKSAELQTQMSFDEAFYYTNSVDFSKKYENFKLTRDLNKEKEVFNKYGLVEGEYIFVHDDRERGYNINMYGEDIVRPGFSATKNIFDFLYLIENAKEIHCMDSCFFIMIDFILQLPKMFYHINTRGDYSLMFPNQGNGVFAHPRYQKNWEIIK